MGLAEPLRRRCLMLSRGGGGGGRGGWRKAQATSRVSAQQGFRVGEMTLPRACPPSLSLPGWDSPSPKPTSSVSSYRQHPPATWPLLCILEGLNPPLDWGKLVKGVDGHSVFKGATDSPDLNAFPSTPIFCLGVQGALTWGGALRGLGKDECG